MIGTGTQGEAPEGYIQQALISAQAQVVARGGNFLHGTTPQYILSGTPTHVTGVTITGVAYNCPQRP